MTWLGLDIGGANLKAADGCGWATCVPFELWRDPNGLQSAVAALIDRAPPAERVAVTMTGELCDCFRTKEKGVRHILAATNAAVDGKELRIYLVDGRFVSIAEARAATNLVAASNWHALARFACRYLSGPSGVLIDIGSTTSDIIPLVDGAPRATGRTDTERLIASELVYTGVGRTPVCAVTAELPWRDARCPVAAEFFATTADAYLLLDQLPEKEDVMSAADGRPTTKHFARERLARMFCADGATFNESDALVAAAAIRDMQLKQLQGALCNVLTSMQRPADECVVSGTGEFLARLVANNVCDTGAVISLSELLGPAISQAAPAYALAVLAAETVL